MGRLPHFDRLLAVWSDRLLVPGEFAVEITKRDNKEKQRKTSKQTIEDEVVVGERFGIDMTGCKHKGIGGKNMKI